MSKKPKFSILIPTRERHDTLHFSMRSVLEQSYPDFELVVSDNLSSPATKECVDKFNDPRVKYVRTSERLAMSDNWEFGLKHCSGEYVFILGDDDALIPNALHEAATIAAAAPDRTISWRLPTYYWPSAILKPSRNQLDLPMSEGRFMVQSHEMLAHAYNFNFPYYYLPMLYNSFVPRSVIEKVRQMNSGNYFYGRAPDVCSGIMNAIASTEYIHTQIPLSLAGQSGHSTGLAQGFQSLGSDAHKKLLSEGKENAERPQLHPTLVNSGHQYFLIADDFLKLGDRFNVAALNIQFNINAFFTWAVNSLWADPGKYEEYLKDVVMFAQKHNIDTTNLQVPYKSEMAERYGCGLNKAPNDPLRQLHLTIDCSKFGITDVWEAAKLLGNLLPNYATGIAAGWRDGPAVVSTPQPTPTPAPEPVKAQAPSAAPPTQPAPVAGRSREEMVVELLYADSDGIRSLFNDPQFMQVFLPLTRFVEPDTTTKFEMAGIVEKLGKLLDSNNCVAGLMGLMLLYPPWELRVSDLNDVPAWFRSTYVDFSTMASPANNSELNLL